MATTIIVGPCCCSSSSASSGSPLSCAGLPNPIYMTVTSGNCVPGIPSGLPLTTVDHAAWTGGATASCNDGTGYGVKLLCDPTGLSIIIGDGSNTYSGGVTVVSTSPFQATFTYTAGTGGCCAGNSVTLTFTS